MSINEKLTSCLRCFVRIDWKNKSKQITSEIIVLVKNRLRKDL